MAASKSPVCECGKVSMLLPVGATDEHATTSWMASYPVAHGVGINHVAWPGPVRAPDSERFGSANESHTRTWAHALSPRQRARSVRVVRVHEPYRPGAHRCVMHWTRTHSPTQKRIVHIGMVAAGRWARAGGTRTSFGHAALIPVTPCTHRNAPKQHEKPSSACTTGCQPSKILCRRASAESYARTIAPSLTHHHSPLPAATSPA